MNHKIRKFNVDYCLSRDLEPKEIFKKTGTLQVYDDKPELQYYINGLRKKHQLDDIKCYLAQEYCSQDLKHQHELWFSEYTYKAVGDPTRILPLDYQLRASDQFIIITKPPGPAIFYQYGVLSNT